MKSYLLAAIEAVSRDMAPPRPFRLWIMRPLVSNQMLILASGNSIGVRASGQRALKLPFQNTIQTPSFGLALITAPPGVIQAALDVINSASATGAVDQAKSQAVIDAARMAGHGDISAVAISAAPPDAGTKPSKTVFVFNATPGFKWVAWAVTIQAVVLKGLAQWLKMITPQVTKLAPAARYATLNSGWLIEALERASTATTVTGAALAGVFLFPMTAQAPTLPSGPIPTGGYVSTTEPDGSVITVGPDGTIVTMGPPELGDITPNSDGGATYTSPVSPPVEIGAPSASSLGGDDGGDGGGGPGRPEIQ